MSRIPYAKTIAACVALAIVGLLSTLVLTHTGRAKPRPAPGPAATGGSEASREAIKPGNYATSINIHNPNPGVTLHFYVKAVLAPEAYVTGTPSPFQTSTFPPDNAMEFDCTEIVGALLDMSTDFTTTFYKGFVVFYAQGNNDGPRPMDVVDVLTAEPPTVTFTTPGGATSSGIFGIALQTVPIPGLQVDVPGPPPPGGTVAPFPGAYYEYSAKFLCGTVAIPPTP